MFGTGTGIENSDYSGLDVHICYSTYYGQAEIDWVALTYFLWEGVVQDLIECTHNVYFRDDWEEESRTEAVQLLDVILAEDRGHIDAAYQASAHLPGDLTVHSRKRS